MRNKDVIDMATRCKVEIQMLRARIAELEPKAHAYDSLSAVIRMLPGPSIGFSEDMVWRLNKQIAELEAADNAEVAVAEQ